MAVRNKWIPWEEPEHGGIFTRDHIDPSFAYMGYKFAITEICELINSVNLSWDFSFGPAQKEYIQYVGKHLQDSGEIDEKSTRADIFFAFSRTSPQETRHILHAQILSSIVAEYLRYLKTTLSFILPNHVSEYPKVFKVDLADTKSAADLDDFVVKSIISEIESLGYSDYPSLKKKCILLDIYPLNSNNDLLMIERYIRTRNEFLHFYPGSEFLSSGYLKQTKKVVCSLHVVEHSRFQPHGKFD